jgi:serine/threonine protein kinase
MTGEQLRSGQVLAGRYRVGAIVGQGGMAEVYGALDERLVRPVAVKVLRGQFADDPALRRRFEEEARAVAMVSHPNVVGVYDAGEDGNVAFIVMELVPGETLAERIARGPLDEAAVRRIGGEVLGALAAAHARGVLHRDIKPANVLLTEDATAKVADFGIAKALQPSPDSNDPTTVNVLGTPSYLAPERAQGQPATVRSDLWSVGVLLYECLTGKKPFEGPTSIAVAMAAMEGRYQPVLERRPGTDPALVAVIERAMQPDPAKRFSSAVEMAGSLRSRTAEETVAFPPLAYDPDATAVLGSPTPTMVLGELGPAGSGLVAASAGAAGGAAGAGGPTAYGANRDESLAGDPPRHRNAAVLAAAVVLVIVAGVGALLLTSALGHGTTVHPHVSETTSTTKPKVVASGTTTTLPASSTTVPASSTTVPASSTTVPSTTTPATSTTTTVPPTTSTTTTTTTTTTVPGSTTLPTT